MLPHHGSVLQHCVALEARDQALGHVLTHLQVAAVGRQQRGRVSLPGCSTAWSAC